MDEIGLFTPCQPLSLSLLAHSCAPAHHVPWDSVISLEVDPTSSSHPPVEIGIRDGPGDPAGVNWDPGLGASEGNGLSHGLSPQSDPMEVIPAAAGPFLSAPVRPLLTRPLCPPAISEIPRWDSMHCHTPESAKSLAICLLTPTHLAAASHKGSQAAAVGTSD